MAGRDERREQRCRQRRGHGPSGHLTGQVIVDAGQRHGEQGRRPDRHRDRRAGAADGDHGRSPDPDRGQHHRRADQCEPQPGHDPQQRERQARGRRSRGRRPPCPDPAPARREQLRSPVRRRRPAAAAPPAARWPTTRRGRRPRTAAWRPTGPAHATAPSSPRLLAQVEQRRIRADRGQAAEVLRRRRRGGRPLERLRLPRVVARRDTTCERQHDVEQEDGERQARSPMRPPWRSRSTSRSRWTPDSPRPGGPCRRSRARASGRTPGWCRRR